MRKKVKTIVECMLTCKWDKSFPVRIPKGKFLRFGFGFKGKLVTIFLMPTGQHKLFVGINEDASEYNLKQDEIQYLTDKLIKGKKC